MTLTSASRATDGAYLAVADVTAIARELAFEYRIVGGNAVTLLTAVYGASHLAPGRETADADFAASHPVISDPRLALAIARPPTAVELTVVLTTGSELALAVDLPDLISMICLKAYAYKGRMHPRDALDIWRLLEAANLAGLDRQCWPTTVTGREAAAILLRHFTDPTGAGPWDATTSVAQRTRIRALAARLTPSG